jgi:hypothetical protein
MNGAHKLLVHIDVFRRWHEDGLLHEPNEAPVGVHLVLDLHQKGSKEVRHALGVAITRVGNGVTQQDISLK